MDDAGWKWYAGSDEENFSIGPCDTREEALAQATDERCGEFKDDGWKLSIYLVEARKDPIRLADYIDVEQMLERADEAVSGSDRASEYDDLPYFDLSAQQIDDLIERIKRACDAWQAEHNIIPAMYTFSSCRKHEHVIIALPDEVIA